VVERLSRKSDQSVPEMAKELDVSRISLQAFMKFMKIYENIYDVQKEDQKLRQLPQPTE
jgi:biotin operon repressor